MDPLIDLAIVGGGIYGATLAYESARRGLSVTLIEQHDSGAATSANSLKVIHGGLRYLQSADIPRARYSAAERRELLAYAPQLIRPLHCQVPLGRSLVKNELSVGLVAAFYNWLTRHRNRGFAIDQQVPDARLVNTDDFQRNLNTPLKEPGDFALDWHDAQAIDTERLQTTFLRDAISHGAELLTYHRLVSLKKQSEYWQLGCEDTESLAPLELRARRVVDCSGAWSVCERLLDREEPKQRRYVKAVNLVLKRKLSDLAFGFNTRSRGSSRLLFAAPCQQHTLLGTWYFDENRPDQPTFDQPAAEECLREVNEAFAEPVLCLADISQVHVGYLPADRYKAEEKDPEAWLQKHNRVLQWEDLPDLWVIKGTKYTTARYTAEQFLKEHLPEAELKATAGEEKGRKPAPLSGPRRRYGHFVEDWESFSRSCGEWSQHILRGAPGHYCGEVIYAIRREWARHLDDILVRRLGLGNLGRPATDTIDHALELLAEHEGWDAGRCELERARLLSRYPDWLS